MYGIIDSIQRGIINSVVQQGAVLKQISFTLSEDNNYVDVVFGSGVYSNELSTLPVFSRCFSIVFTKGSGSATNIEILGITTTSNSELSGGESTIRIHLYIEGECNGNEMILISTVENSIYSNGLAITAKNSGNISMNEEVIDYIATTKNIDSYVDFADGNYVDDSSDFIVTEKSANNFLFSQNVSANKPTKQSGYVQFSGNQFISTNNPVYLKTAYSLFFVIDRDNATSDDRIITTNPSGLISNLVSYIQLVMIRSTTVIVNHYSDIGISFSYSIGTGKKIIEIRNDGNGTALLFVNGAQVATSSAPILNINAFNTISAYNGTQPFDGKIYNITLLNSNSTTKITSVYQRLFDKYISATKTTNNIRNIFHPIIYGMSLMGQSNAAGRSNLDDLSVENAVYKNEITAAYILPNSYSTYGISTYDPKKRYYFENTENQFGAENSAMKSLIDYRGSGFVHKYGVGGSSLGNTSDPTDWYKAAGETYPRAIISINVMLQYLRSQLLNPNLIGVLWLQGETDANNLTNATAYQSNFTQFISDVRSDLKMPDLPFIFYKIQSGTYKSDVNNAVNTIANNDVNVYYDSETDNMTTIDGIHYDADSMIILGNHFFNNYLKILINN